MFTNMQIFFHENTSICWNLERIVTSKIKVKISKENKNNQGGQEYESVCNSKVT